MPHPEYILYILATIALVGVCILIIDTVIARRRFHKRLAALQEAECALFATIRQTIEEASKSDDTKIEL